MDLKTWHDEKKILLWIRTGNVKMISRRRDIHLRPRAAFINQNFPHLYSSQAVLWKILIDRSKTAFQKYFKAKYQLLLTAIVLFRLCPLAAYGRSHDKSSLFLWWVGNQTSTKKLLHKWCFAERLKIVFCCIYSVGFPIFQYVCSRWDFGNMEMPQLTSFSASACHHVIGGSRF